MEKQPILNMVSGAEALEQVRRFPLPVDTGVFHIPEQQLTWPMIIPQGGLQVQLRQGTDEQLTYGMVTGIVAFADTFHLLGRVDYAYGGAEHTSLFRLDWAEDRKMIEAIGELGILVLSDRKPKAFASRDELVAYLSEVPTFVCELDAQELHRLRIQMIRMNAQAEFGV